MKRKYSITYWPAPNRPPLSGEIILDLINITLENADAVMVRLEMIANKDMSIRVHIHSLDQPHA